MASDADMSNWSDLLHSSSKLLEQAAPSAQFPPLQRNLDQLEALSKKLKAKSLRTEAPSQSIAATRLLAREGLNAEQLARDLKSFELKTTFEDVFPAEATSVEEYLQQVHEMAMVSAVQEAQKDNLKSFNDHMMNVLVDDWQKEKRDLLQSLSRISTLPKTNMSNYKSTPQGQIMAVTSSSPQVSFNSSNMELTTLSNNNKPLLDEKAAAYYNVVKDLNRARERGLTFKPATAFKNAYESLGVDTSGGKSVTMQKIWHLVQTLMNEDSNAQRDVTKKMSLVIGARRHLEWGHEKYVMDTIQSHPAQAALGGAVDSLHRIQAFLRIRLRDYGLLDFDATDARRQPPVDTTWQQIYFCLRTGYYTKASEVAQSSRVSLQFAPLLNDWITRQGMVTVETAITASEECEKLLRTHERVNKKKILLYALISGSRKLIDRLLRELPTLFNTIEDFLWFKLSSIREYPNGSSIILNDGVLPYSLSDLQTYLNKFDPSYYTKNGKDPLVYPYVLFLSVQFLPAVVYLSRDIGYCIHGVHLTMVGLYYGVLFESSGRNVGVMDGEGEGLSIVRRYGSELLRKGEVGPALEYYVAACGGGGGGEVMMKGLLMEIIVSEGEEGFVLLMGKGSGEGGELERVMRDGGLRREFLCEAARYCEESGLYDKSIEIHRRIGAFSAALDTVNKCLSEAICALARGKSDSGTRISGLIHSGNEILETFKYSPQISPQERENVFTQQTVLNQLEAVLNIQKMTKSGHYLDALKEVSKLPFLPLDMRSSDYANDVFQKLSPHVQACVPDLLRTGLLCLDNVKDTDGSLRALRTKIANFLANNLNRNWPQDLYEKVARSL